MNSLLSCFFCILFLGGLLFFLHLLEILLPSELAELGALEFEVFFLSVLGVGFDLALEGGVE